MSPRADSVILQGEEASLSETSSASVVELATWCGTSSSGSQAKFEGGGSGHMDAPISPPLYLLCATAAKIVW